MLGLDARGSDWLIQRVLAIGCHADDIEIGCGGTLLALVRAKPELDVTWVVLAATGECADGATGERAAFLARATDVRVHAFRDGFLPYAAAR